MTPYYPIAYTATIDMELVENFLKGKQNILDRLSEILPESVEVDLEFDHYDGEIEDICTSTHTVAYTAMVSLYDNHAEAIYPTGSEFEKRIRNTIYCTIKSRLALYETDEGREMVKQAEIERAVDYLEMQADAIHEERRMGSRGQLK